MGENNAKRREKKGGKQDEHIRKRKGGNKVIMCWEKNEPPN